MLAAALLWSAPAPAQSASKNPLDFLGNIFTARSPVRPAPSPAQPASTGGAQPWSGEDGASGHPLMTASAIREAAANFDSCVASMWPDAARRNISQESFQRFTAGLTPDLRIMDLLDSQPEFTKSIWDYLDILVNDARLAKGREILAKYKPQFDATEKAYGVDRYIIAAIWGIESNYSTQMGDRSVLQSTATLACIGRRQKYFRDEFLSALEILHHGDLQPRPDARLMGRRIRADPIHADGVQALCGRCRWRRPPQRRRRPRRPDRVDRQQPEEGRLADRPELGLRGRGAEGLQLHAGGPRQGDDACAVGASRPQARQRPAVSGDQRKGLSAGAGRRRRARDF